MPSYSCTCPCTFVEKYLRNPYTDRPTPVSERRVRLSSADAPAEGSRFSSYWERLPLTSCPSTRHSVQPFHAPQRKYRSQESDGTRYPLREKVRFFEPFRYGATCVEVHEEKV